MIESLEKHFEQTARKELETELQELVDICHKYNNTELFKNTINNKVLRSIFWNVKSEGISSIINELLPKRTATIRERFINDVQETKEILNNIVK